MSEMLHTFHFIQTVLYPAHKTEHILDWVIHWPDDQLFQSVDVSCDLSCNHFCMLINLADFVGSALVTDRTQTVPTDGQTSSPTPPFLQSPKAQYLASSCSFCTLLSCFHYVSHQSYANGIQLCCFSLPSDSHSALNTIEVCIGDIRDWMAQNKLKPNNDKMDSKRRKDSSLLNPPKYVKVYNTNITFTLTIQNLGFIDTVDMILDTKN